MALEKSKDEKEKTSQDEKVEKVTSKEVQDQQEEQMVPMSQIDSIIKERMGEFSKNSRDVDLATAIAEAMVRAQNENETKKFDPFSYLSRAEISKDDWLDEPVKFWALGILLVIGDDKREGQNIPAPRGLIKFLPQGTKRKPRGKETEIQILCAYETRSKLEAEFLQRHTLCGARFFLKSTEAFDVNIRFAQKVAAYAQGMMNTHANQVISMARELGLNVDDDINTLRIAVAQHRAKVDVDRYEEIEKETLAENSKINMLNAKQSAVAKRLAGSN